MLLKDAIPQMSESSLGVFNRNMKILSTVYCEQYPMEPGETFPYLFNHVIDLTCKHRVYHYFVSIRFFRDYNGLYITQIVDSLYLDTIDMVNLYRSLVHLPCDISRMN